MSLFGSNFVPPPPHVNKTIEQRKEDMRNGIYSYAAPQTRKSPISKLITPLFVVMIFFFFSFTQKSEQSQKIIYLSPDYPDYSAVSVISQKADIICRGVVIARGHPKTIETLNENGKSNKMLFTPILLDVITPICGDFPKMQASYLELGGTTKSQIVEVSGVMPLAVDDEVFLFYNKNGTGFGNWSVYHVVDDTITIESSRLPDSVSSADEYTTISADDFTALIKTAISNTVIYLKY